MGLDAARTLDWLRAMDSRGCGVLAVAGLRRTAGALAADARLEDLIPMAGTDHSAAPPEDPDRPCCGYCGAAERPEIRLADDGTGLACAYLDGCLARRDRRFPDREYPWAAGVRQRAAAARAGLIALTHVMERFTADLDARAPALAGSEQLRLSVVAERQAARRAAQARGQRPAPGAGPVRPVAPMASREPPAPKPVAWGRYVVWVKPGRGRAR